MKKFDVEITETSTSSKVVTLDVPDDWTEGDIRNKLTGHSLDMSPEDVEKEHGVKVYDLYPNNWQDKDLDIMGRGFMGIGEIHERTLPE
jgi:hypothetical protein|tara:strand:- start:43 stop:309 length:267 start_codon:yes stop_codon:yes gene_type:complete